MGENRKKPLSPRAIYTALLSVPNSPPQSSLNGGCLMKSSRQSASTAGELLAQIADKDEEIKGFVRALAKERRERKNDTKQFNEMCVTLKAGFDELKEDCDTLEDCIRAIAPKAEYSDIILNCANAIPVSVIAKDYGMTAAAFNKLLHSVGI
jgi:hypothetical protein